MSKMNRLANCKNEFQGEPKRVLCVSQAPYNFNTRAAGLTQEFALIPVDDVLLFWADEIVCMEQRQQKELQLLAPGKPVLCLDIEDSYPYRSSELMQFIAEKYNEVSKGNSDGK